jgi:hypothetical protein
MKTIFTLVLTCALHIAAFATVRTVNNINGIDADYATMVSAINASQAGDTLYIMPSPTTYGNFTVNKQLFILGAGHNPEYTAYSAICGTITLSAQSTGTVIKGLNISIIATDNNVINNIVIGNNYISNTNAPFSFNNVGTYNNWIFEGNVMYTANANFLNFTGLGANLILRNNFIHTSTLTGVLNFLPTGTVVDHNIITAYSSSTISYPIVNSSNIVIRNNIFYFTNSNVMYPADYCPGCAWEKNILFSNNSSIYNIPGTNYVNQDPAMVSFSTIWNYNADFHLTESSPGVGQATDGTDIGIYGGIHPFSMFGFDAGLPRIAEFELLNTSAPQGGTISIQLRATGSGQ